MQFLKLIGLDGLLKLITEWRYIRGEFRRRNQYNPPKRILSVTLGEVILKKGQS